MYIHTRPSMYVLISHIRVHIHILHIQTIIYIISPYTPQVSSPPRRVGGMRVYGVSKWVDGWWVVVVGWVGGLCQSGETIKNKPN